MNDQSVLIIGGGVIGVCSAYFLARSGVSVTLIEKDEIASGCSYGNGGLIVPSHAVPLASPEALGNGLRWLLDPESPFYIRPRLDLAFFSWLLRFVRDSNHQQVLTNLPIMRDLLFASRSLYAELAQEFDFGFEGNGSLTVYLSEQALQHEIKEAQLLKRFDIPLEVLDQDQVHKLEPALCPEVIGGIFYSRDGHINPHQFVTRLAARAQELGAQVWTQTEVQDFESANGKITRVWTNRGDVSPRHVILAAGSWSPHIARDLRLQIPIQPAKGYSLTFENPPVRPTRPLSFGEASVVLNPLREGLRVAGTLELAGMDFSINQRRVDAIRKASNRYIVGLEDARVLETWRGLRPCTPDGLPIISRSMHFNNLIVAAGHAMLGMSLGPITGRLVAQLINGENPELDLSPFHINRF